MVMLSRMPVTQPCGSAPGGSWPELRLGLRAILSSLSPILLAGLCPQAAVQCQRGGRMGWLRCCDISTQSSGTHGVGVGESLGALGYGGCVTGKG